MEGDTEKAVERPQVLETGVGQCRGRRKKLNRPQCTGRTGVSFLGLYTGRPLFGRAIWRQWAAPDHEEM